MADKHSKCGKLNDVIIPVRVNLQPQIRGCCFLQAQADIWHIAEINELCGGFRINAGFDSSVDQPSTETILLCADGDGIIGGNCSVYPYGMT